MRKSLWILALVLVSSAIYTAIVVPLTVPPGHIGIIQSDAFGPVEAIVDASGAHLVWSRLIPGDTRIHIFPEGRRLTRRSIRIVLPPGNLPGQTNTHDFTCVLDCSIGYTVVRTALPALLKAGVTNADVILTRLADRIEPVIRHALIRETETALLAEQPPRLVSASQTALSNEAAPQANAWLAGFGLPPAEISISWKTLPDPTAYMRMRMAIAQAIPELTEQIRDWHVGAKISDTRPAPANGTACGTSPSSSMSTPKFWSIWPSPVFRTKSVLPFYLPATAFPWPNSSGRMSLMSSGSLSVWQRNQLEQTGVPSQRMREQGGNDDCEQRE